MNADLTGFLKKRKARRASGKINKRILLLNTLGFSIVLLTSLSESVLIVKLLLLLYVIVNLVLYLIWHKIKRNLDALIFALNAFISYITSYDYLYHGSRYVYFIYYLIGMFFTLQLFIVIFKRSSPVKEDQRS